VLDKEAAAEPLANTGLSDYCAACRAKDQNYWLSVSCPYFDLCSFLKQNSVSRSWVNALHLRQDIVGRAVLVIEEELEKAELSLDLTRFMGVRDVSGV
jgi:hypothetical protein